MFNGKTEPTLLQNTFRPDSNNTVGIFRLSECHNWLENKEIIYNDNNMEKNIMTNSVYETPEMEVFELVVEHSIMLVGSGSDSDDSEFGY